MEKKIEKSCWSTMSWTVLALSGALVIVYLLGGFEAAVVATG